LARHAGLYKSEKRRKELARQKKQEKKMKRRLSKGISAQKDTELIDSEGKDTGQEN